MLTGGNSMLPGLAQRLQRELVQLLPRKEDKAAVKVQAQPGRENFTWDGGAHLCSLSSFQRLWLGKQEWMETGGVAVNGGGLGGLKPEEEPKETTTKA